MTPLELEQCVLVASDVTSPKHWEATCLLQAWNVDSSILLQTAKSTRHDQVLFYALTEFPRSTSTHEQRVELRQFLLRGRVFFDSSTPTHVLTTKAGVVLAYLIQKDFPNPWETAFQDLQQQARPELFLRTVQALQQDESKFSTIKDVLRGYHGDHGALSIPSSPEQSMTAQLVDTLLHHVHSNANDDMLRTLALRVLAQFASWVDVSLLVRQDVLTLVYESLVIDNENVGVAAMKFLQELVSRGMDNNSKVQLLHQTDMLQKIHSAINLELVDASPIGVVIEVAQLINTTGLELAPMMMEPASPQLLLQQPIWPQVMELFRKCFAYDDIDVSGAVVPLAGRLASMEGAPLEQLLTIMYRQMKYPSNYAFDYQDDDESEEEVYRCDLRKLYTKLVRGSPDLVLQFTCQALAALPVPLSSSSTVDMEVALRLVYHYCEGIKPPGLKTVMKNATFRAVLVALHQSDITSHPHREVLLLYYDTSVRYYPIFIDQPELLPLILEALSGERGLQHPNVRVKSRSCYLLLRLVKSVVNVMRPYVEPAVTGIQGLLCNTNSYQQLRTDDALYLFETMGLLLGKTGLAPTEQRDALTKVMSPHIQLMNEQLRDEIRDPDYTGEVLASSIAAIAYLSKGFSKAPAVQVQAVLAETVIVTLRVLEALPDNDKVRSKTFINLQRMIQCIGDNVLLHMSRFLQLLIEHCTTDDIQDVAQLFNQLCIKFKERAIPSIDPNLLSFLRKCQDLSSSLGETDGVNGNGSYRPTQIPPHLQTEQLTIKKLSFTVLQHVVMYQVSPVLTSPTNAASFQLVLDTMSNAAMQVQDAVVKKVCLSFFRELVDQWVIGTNHNNNSNDGSSSSTRSIVDGLVQFLLQIFIPGMIQCILSPSFQETDALQARNVHEFAHVLFLLKSRLPKEFDNYVVNGTLASIPCCPSQAMNSFHRVETLEEMDLCWNETIKVLKKKRMT